MLHQRICKRIMTNIKRTSVKRNRLSISGQRGIVQRWHYDLKSDLEWLGLQSSAVRTRVVYMYEQGISLLMGHLHG